ncbi:MAG: copper chaperone PCu(A)C [Actinobacteria bacterium]|nr:copper chaperone PCu(A)C [Actinomycetota bacterium]MBI3687471.1 copper chaperone PCu(A)C [Actinomycetota bacterium]
MSRSIRTTRAAGLAALALAGLFTTACSAGQTAQTSVERSAVDGASGTAGSIALRNVRLAYPASGRYQAGSNAALAFAAVNSGLKDDSLVSIRTDAAAGVSLMAAPSTTSGTTTGARPAALAPVLIPAGQLVTFGADGVGIQLVGLTSQLRSAQNVPITFSFASGGSVTINVPVTTPETEVPRPPSGTSGS